MDEEPTQPEGLCVAKPKRLVTSRISGCYVPGEVPLIIPAKVRYLIVHMCSFSRLTDDNPHPIADELLDAESMTARQRQDPYIRHPAYQVICKLDGALEQCLPLTRRGSHAIGYNSTSWALCVVGEGAVAGTVQLGPSAEVAALLVMLGHISIENIVGHADLPGSSRDPTKRCPWPRVAIQQFRALVAGKLTSGWQTLGDAVVRELVVEAGLVI